MSFDVLFHHFYATISVYMCRFCFVLWSMGKTAQNRRLTSFQANGRVCLSVIYSDLSQSKSQMHQKAANGRNQRGGQWQCFFCVSLIAVSLSNLTQLNDVWASLGHRREPCPRRTSGTSMEVVALFQKKEVSCLLDLEPINQDSGRVFSNRSQSQLCPLKSRPRCKCVLCPVWKRLSVTALPCQLLTKILFVCWG